MSADKYPCIFSRQMETIVYLSFVNELSFTVAVDADPVRREIRRK